MKKISRHVLFSLLTFCLFAVAKADNPLGQTIQIYTHFHSVVGKPSWLLILRDVDTGQVLPYLYDIRNNDNFWLAVSFGHSYRVTVSNLKWGAYASIHNFCQLENGILSGTSMYLTLTGNLTPNPGNSTCRILKYKDS